MDLTGFTHTLAPHLCFVTLKFISRLKIQSLRVYLWSISRACETSQSYILKFKAPKTREMNSLVEVHKTLEEKCCLREKSLKTAEDSLNFLTSRILPLEVKTLVFPSALGQWAIWFWSFFHENTCYYWELLTLQQGRNKPLRRAAKVFYEELWQRKVSSYRIWKKRKLKCLEIHLTKHTVFWFLLVLFCCFGSSFVFCRFGLYTQAHTHSVVTRVYAGFKTFCYFVVLYMAD